MKYLCFPTPDGYIWLLEGILVACGSTRIALEDHPWVLSAIGRRGEASVHSCGLFSVYSILWVVWPWRRFRNEYVH